MANLLRRKSIAQIEADAAAGLSEHGSGEPTLRRTLTLFDLTMLGIAAIVGAGIFSMVGKVAHDGGPAVIFLFIFAATACGFAALCYGEFASRIPIAGSAYTYTYASMGELIAWIIGWDLILEYAIGNIAVAISWSDYFTGLMRGLGVNIPAYFSMDYISASRSAEEASKFVQPLIEKGNTLESLRSMTGDELKALTEGLTPKLVEAYEAWTTAPQIAGFPLIADVPALAITVILTALVYIGIRETKRVANFMTILKISVIIFVILVGIFYVDPGNWSPFAPNGVGGVLKGVAGVFFAYIGFDALATTAEEANNPHRDLPRAMIYSLVICTILYCILALVLTGMVSYEVLNVGDPLAYVFGPEGADISWIKGIVAVSAVIAIGTVFLVFQIGQPRLWMAISRDGLLPKIFSSIHPKYGTPWFATIVAGVLVAIPALFMNLDEVTDLTSIGTLFAFVLVCAGVLFKQKEWEGTKSFVPYINGQVIVPVLLLILLAGLYYFNNNVFVEFFTITPVDGETMLRAFSHKIPTIAFILLAGTVGWLSIVKKFSLIPVLGLLSCAYLMSTLEFTNWLRFGAWLVAGMVIYFAYGFHNSRLAKAGL